MSALGRIRWLRALVAVGGGAATIAGAIALLTTDNGAASLLLLTVGLVLTLVAWLGPRVELESFELLGAKLRVRQVVARRLELAEREPSSSSRHDRAALHQQAAALQQLNRLYGLYGHIRATQPVGDHRTEMLDQVARRMQAATRDSDFDRAEVAAWFDEGTDELRVVALNIMLARPDCRDVLAALKAIEQPRNRFEQYYGLLVADAMACGLDALERELVADAVTRASRRRRFRRDADIVELANRVVDRLEHDIR